ncbi:MAG: hypothetical protein V4563_03515 [Pseudomonadota bacterium]
MSPSNSGLMSFSLGRIKFGQCGRSVEPLLGLPMSAFWNQNSIPVLCQKQMVELVLKNGHSKAKNRSLTVIKGGYELLRVGQFSALPNEGSKPDADNGSPAIL